jgi:hypothetical protein
LNYDLKFKPLYAKISFEYHHLTYQQILYKEQIELGATYRLQDSFGNDKFCCDSELRIGYAYDRTISDLKVSAPSSHEFILLYDLFTPKKVSRSPRFSKI